jgi:hypothetical protein
MKRKEKKKTKGMEGGSDEGDDVKKHLYCGLLPPGTNVDICTEYLTRYKCVSSFVSKNLYRFNNRYKRWLHTGTSVFFQ